MWPSGKKIKEVTSVMKSMELEFVATWRRDRNEVEIMTNGVPFVLNEKTEFYIEISNEYLNPIKVQIVPDFKTRKLNFIEVLDPNAKIDNNKGIITFSGNKNRDESIGTRLEEIDEDMKRVDRELKTFKRRKLILLSFSILVILLNIALFIIGTYPGRYLNIIAITICTYSIYRFHKFSKDIDKRYDEIKMAKDEMFGTVKEM